MCARDSDRRDRHTPEGLRQGGDKYSRCEHGGDGYDRRCENRGDGHERAEDRREEETRGDCMSWNVEHMRCADGQYRKYSNTTRESSLIDDAGSWSTSAPTGLTPVGHIEALTRLFIRDH